MAHHRRAMEPVFFIMPASAMAVPGGIGPRAFASVAAHRDGRGIQGLHREARQVSARGIASRLTSGQPHGGLSGRGCFQCLANCHEALGTNRGCHECFRDANWVILRPDCRRSGSGPCPQDQTLGARELDQSSAVSAATLAARSSCVRNSAPVSTLPRGIRDEEARKS